MVENTFKELDIDGLNLTWKAFDNVTSSGFFQHFHDFYEVLYFVKAKADYIIENNVYPVSDGDIILMHDLYENSYEAFCIIIERLHGMGYEFVTVSELLGEKYQTGKKFWSGR